MTILAMGREQLETIVRGLRQDYAGGAEAAFLANRA